MAATPQSVPYPLRMPDELRAQLSDRAKRNGRSINAEIVSILQGELAGDKVELASVGSGDLLDEVMRRFGRQVNITINATGVGGGSEVN